MYHIKGEELISLQNETNVFDGLRITGLFFMTGAEFPLFAQNDRPFFFPFGILGTEDNKLLIMIDERPAPRPVPAGGPTTLDKLFSVHADSPCSLIEKHFIGNCRQE